MGPSSESFKYAVVIMMMMMTMMVMTIIIYGSKMSVITTESEAPAVARWQN